MLGQLSHSSGVQGMSAPLLPSFSPPAAEFRKEEGEVGRGRANSSGAHPLDSRSLCKQWLELVPIHRPDGELRKLLAHLSSRQQHWAHSVCGAQPKRGETALPHHPGSWPKENIHAVPWTESYCSQKLVLCFIDAPTKTSFLLRSWLVKTEVWII